MAFSYYICNLLNRYLFLGESISSPVPNTSYLALSTGALPYPDMWVEPSGYDYARVPIVFSWAGSGNNYAYNNSVVYFNRATGNWGTITNAVLYNTSSGGNALFDMPFVTDPAHTVKIPSFPVTSGCRVYLPVSRVVMALRGKQDIGGTTFSQTNGAISADYSGLVMQWLLGMTTLAPTQRIYDIAIGSYAQYDFLGRFGGVWTECSGTGYRRIPLAVTDWQTYDTYIANKYEIVFTEAAGSNWGSITDFVLYVHNTNTAAFWGHFATSTTVNSGQGFSIGALYLSIRWEGTS